MFMGTRGRRVCKVAYPRESKMFFNGAPSDPKYIRPICLHLGLGSYSLNMKFYYLGLI